jgi:transcriptional regulator with XRE-family HTH domain
VRKSKLSPEDIAICQRLREARGRLGITHIEVARQIGLERSTLLNYEHCRTPLRFEVALQFCRQFIVSEEWLATGEYGACHAAAVKHKIPIKRGPELEVMNKNIFFRQCLDLRSEPSSLHIPPGTLFSKAFWDTLALEYARLIQSWFYYPRISLSDSDNPDLANNLLTVINARFIFMLSNEALRRGKNPPLAWRVYTRCVFEAADLIFKKMMHYPLGTDNSRNLDWLRHVLSEPDSTIEFLDDAQAAHRRTSPEILVSK